jgi:hypothetical protein
VISESEARVRSRSKFISTALSILADVWLGTTVGAAPFSDFDTGVGTTVGAAPLPDFDTGVGVLTAAIASIVASTEALMEVSPFIGGVSPWLLTPLGASSEVQPERITSSTKTRKKYLVGENIFIWFFS